MLKISFSIRKWFSRHNPTTDFLFIFPLHTASLLLFRQYVPTYATYFIESTDLEFLEHETSEREEASLKKTVQLYLHL